MYLYLPVKEQLFHPDIGAYTSFGLAAFLAVQQLAFISDVSTDLALVQDLSQSCTDGQLEPIHLQDVILNSLT